jgi:hypothetical protein
MMRRSLREQFNMEGYVVIPKLLCGAELERVRDVSNRALSKFYEETDKTNPGKDLFRLNNFVDPRWYDNKEDLITILELGADPRLLGPVEQIFEGRSYYRTSIFWMNPRMNSLEGDWHRDTQFAFKTEDEERSYVTKLREVNRLRGVQFQIALVDSSDFEYVPYSVQRWDSPEEYYYRLADNRAHCRETEGMPNAVRIHLEEGDAILLNQVGIHRGRYHTDKLRRTLMYSYTPASNPIFGKVQNINSHWEDEGYLDQLSPRAVTYFKEYIKAYKEYLASGNTSGFDY